MSEPQCPAQTLADGDVGSLMATSVILSWGIIGIRGGCACVRAGGMWEISVLSTQFFCELKRVLNDKARF